MTAGHVTVAPARTRSPRCGAIPDADRRRMGRRAAARRLRASTPSPGAPWATCRGPGRGRGPRRARGACRVRLGRGARHRTERARLLRRLAELIAENASRIAVVETTDNGKLIREMEGQLRGLADYYQYFAGAADKIDGETIPADRDELPHLHAARAGRRRRGDHAVELAGAADAAGSWRPRSRPAARWCVKPAEQAPASTLEFAALVEEAGFPPGVVNVVTGYGAEAGAPLVAHPGVDKVAFTGGTATGKAVMKGAAEHLARVTPGARRQVAATSCSPTPISTPPPTASSRGSSPRPGRPAWPARGCSSQDAVHDEFVERLAARARSDPARRPARAATEMGPVAFRGHLQNVWARSPRRARRARGSSPAAAGAPELATASSSSRRSSATSPTAWASRGRGLRAGARGAALRRRGGGVALANDTSSGSRPACGRATCSARTGWRASCAPAPCGSTPTAASARWRRSAASRRAASGARTGSRRSRVHRDQDRLGRAHRRDARPVQARLRGGRPGLTRG